MPDVSNVTKLRIDAAEGREVAFVVAGSDELWSDPRLVLANRFEDLAAIEALARHGPFLDQFAAGEGNHPDRP